jgi:glycine/D-amino acid oxidase-like deaminating enzyme
MVPSEAQIVIIGGGVLGTSAAFQLAAAGHQSIVLLDRGPIAGGTTPFAAGQTAYLPAHKHLLPFTTYCIEFFERFAESTRATPSTFTSTVASALSSLSHTWQALRLVSKPPGRCMTRSNG